MIDLQLTEQELKLLEEENELTLLPCDYGIEEIIVKPILTGDEF